jgi:aminopeptidase
MPPDFDARLAALAEVIVRIGLNLQPGQPLLITDPYDLQGVHPEAGTLIGAVGSALAPLEPGRPRPGIDVLPANPAALRALLETDNLPAYEARVATHTRRLQKHLASGGAFLFLTGTAPQLFTGLPADRLARFDAVKWRHLGPLIQRLVRGATQWTLVPSPTSDWAAAADTDVPALWETVFASLHVGPAPVAGPRSTNPSLPTSGSPTSEVITTWSSHLATLTRRRDTLNTARHRRIRYIGPGTDLTLELPRSHVWCTAQLATKAGVPFVANLPTEEVFTAPRKHSAHGTMRVARAVAHNGVVIEGIELRFHAGRVTQARARSGEELLHRLLATDAGASRIGEVALVPSLEGRSPTDRASWQTSRPFFHHTLLDENAAPHLALGEAYRFCSRALFPLSLNSSQLHLDLPLDAEVELS